MAKYLPGQSGNPHPSNAYKPGQSGNPAGRPKRLINVIKSLPKDIQVKVFEVLGYCLTLPDETAAKKYLECQEGELGKYGFVMQIAIKQLLKEGWGFGAMMDILDRLYGKPRITADVAHTGGISVTIVTDEETKELIEGGLG